MTSSKFSVARAVRHQRLCMKWKNNRVLKKNVLFFIINMHYKKAQLSLEKTRYSQFLLQSLSVSEIWPVIC